MKLGAGGALASGAGGSGEGFSLMGKTGLEEFVADANEAIRFKLVRNSDQVTGGNNDEDVFHPEMSHQIYGEQ